MSKIADQVHTKFKLFTGPLDASGNLGALAGQVTAWAKDARVAAKSIGVEFVESTKHMILSVGYRDDEPAYGITLASSKIGKLGKLDAAELARLERAMGAAAAKIEHVICHELYVTDANELFVVTMAHA
jgi:hypothetical protein